MSAKRFKQSDDGASKFAEASRATASSHHFSKLGAHQKIDLKQGQVPATSKVADDAVGPTYDTDDAPRPINVDPAQTGAFHTITPGQGAVLSTRETAARAADAARESLPSDKKKRTTPSTPPTRSLVAVIVVAVLVILLLAVGLYGCLSSATPQDDPQAASVANTVAPETSVAPSQRVTVSGYTYGFTKQSDGKTALARMSQAESNAVCTLSGTPIALVSWHETIYVPENLPDGSWDIVSYMAVDGAMPSQLLKGDGQPYGGSATLSSASLEGDTITLTTSENEEIVVPLA